MDMRFPLSHPQRRIWYTEMEQPTAALNNLALVWVAPPDTTFETLQGAWRSMVESYDGMRLAFHRQPAGDSDFPVSQSVLGPDRFPLERLRFASCEQAEAWMQAEAAVPFELYEQPMVKAWALEVAGKPGPWFYLKAHHAVTDGASILLTIQALEAALAGRALVEQPSYQLFVVAEQEYLGSSQAVADRDFWLEATREPLEPLDFGAGSADSGYAFVVEQAPEAVLEGCRAFTAAHGVSLYKQVLAAWSAVLSRLGRSREFALGIANHNRWLGELREACGMFVSTLPSVTRFDPSLSFLEHAQEGGVRLNRLLKERSRYPLDLLVSEQRRAHDVDLSGLTDLSLVGHPDSSTPYRWITMGYVPRGLALHVNPQGAYSRGRLEFAYAFDRSRFSASVVQALHDALLALLGQAHLTPERPLGDLGLLTPEAEEAVLAFNGGFVPYPDRMTVPELFAQRVEEAPDKAAVVSGEEVLSYRRLELLSDALAGALTDQAPVAGRFVGVCLPRTSHLVVALLGILKAGAAYVPLDPEYPAERIQAMIEDAEIAAVVATPAYAHLLGGLPLIDPERIDPAPSPSTEDREPSLGSPTDLAYAIFTSGTTGRPKGVPIEHHQVIHLAQALSEPFRIGPESRVVFFASLNFDASVAEIFPTLLQGGTLVVANEAHRTDGGAFAELLRDTQVTCATIPPALLAVMPKEPLPELTDLVVAGESTDPAVISYWSKGRRMINAYGPTENTVATSAGVFGADTPSNDIGRPLANVFCYVLDSCLKPVPVGLPGELYVAGVGVSRGYLGRPELTADRFLSNPWAAPELRNPRMYKTGDLVRWRPEGRLEFIGRVDFQVKIRGHRIECGEVSTALAGLPGVASCLVLAQPHGSSHRLVAYLIPEEGVELSRSALRSAAAEKLPQYMLPSAFVLCEEFPRTPNGKIDRRALPAPSFDEASEVRYVGPRNAREEQLCELWAEILGVDRVGIQDDFFELGGDSLSCMKMVAQAQDAGFTFEVAAVRAQPTVEALCVDSSPGQAEALPPLSSDPSREPFPMPVNALMMRRQLQAVLATGAEFKETLVLWDLHGPLDEGALQAALVELRVRHDALRLAIVDRGDQVLLEEAPLGAPVAVEPVDLGALPTLLEEWAGAHSVGTDLPACTFRIFRLGPEHRLLGLRATHELIDAWATELLRNELATLYRRRVGDDDAPGALPPAHQIRDFTSWYHELIEAGRWSESEKYWRTLARSAAAPFPAPPRPQPEQNPYRCVSAFVPFSTALRDRLEQLCRSRRATPFEGSYAVYQLLLAQRTGQNRLLSACVTALRDSQALQTVVASLTNRQYLLVELSAERSFAQALEATQGALRAAQEHKWWPAWSVLDPEGRGFPDVFFHYVPGGGARGADFGSAQLSQRPPGPPAYWPLGLAFQFLDGPQPALMLLGRAGFCDQPFLEELARDYVALLDTVS